MKTFLPGKRAFTLPEMLVVLGLMGIIFAGILAGMMHFGESVVRARRYVRARQEIAVFVQACFSFCNRSQSAYFLDLNAMPIEPMNYLATFDASLLGDPSLDRLYLVQDDAGNTGSFVFDPGNRRISWIRNDGDPSDLVVVMERVFRVDYVDDSDPGTAPVFKLPHNQSLYNTSIAPPRPSFVVFEFLNQIHEPTAGQPEPEKVFVKFFAEVNAV